MFKRATTLVVILLTIRLILQVAAVEAAPAAAGDPVTACTQGINLFRSGRAKEAVSLLGAGFAGRDRVTFSDADDLGECALALGVLRYNGGDRTGALDAYTVAEEIFRGSGNRVFEAITLNNTGAVYQAQGRYLEALKVYQQALMISREVDDRLAEGATLANIGLVYHLQGRHEEALRHYEQALAIRREIGDRAGEGSTLTNIGGVYQEQGHYADALNYHRQALAIRREVNDRTGEGATLADVGWVYHEQGHYAEALAYYQEALAIERDLGNRPGEGATLDNIGLVYHKLGRYAEALDYYQQALLIVQQVENPIHASCRRARRGAHLEYRRRTREDVKLVALLCYECSSATSVSSTAQCCMICPPNLLVRDVPGLFEATAIKNADEERGEMHGVAWIYQ